jgi:hypothetical protein
MGHLTSTCAAPHFVVRAVIRHFTGAEVGVVLLVIRPLLLRRRRRRRRVPRATLLVGLPRRSGVR